MADPTQNPSAEPEGIDDYLTDQDPQSAIAAQGMKQLGTAVGNEAQAQYEAGGQRIHQALTQANAGDYSGLQDMAVQTAAGTLGGEMPHLEGYGPIDSGIMQKATAMFPEAKSLGELKTAVANSSLSEAHPISQAVQQAVQQRTTGSFAEGGSVDQRNLAEAGGNVQGFADGGEPEGIDQYLGGAPQPQTPPQTPQDPNEPEGINDYLAPELNEAKYGTPGQVATTAAESFGKGLFGPASTAAEVGLGVDPADIRARESTNPTAHYAGEIAGLIVPSLVSGGTGALAKAAEFTQAGALEKLGANLPEFLTGGETLAARIGQGAAKGAIDNMLIQGSDEVSKMILKDPSQSAETAIGDIGLAGQIGAMLGGGVPVIGAGLGKLWEANVGTKVGKVIEDFKSRVNEHIDNPDPAASMTDELGQYYKAVNGATDPVYGSNGLKAQAIEKSMPDMNPKMSEQVQTLANKVNDQISTMAADPYTYPPRLTKMLQSDFDNFADKVSNPDAQPKDLFNATQDLKQTLQGYAKFEKRIAPFSEEAGFVQAAKGLQYDFRTALEDTGVWGDAARVQNKINTAFKEYLPTLQDFEKKFTTEVAGERQIDPGKVNTYINQVGKPNAEIKQTMLKNFLDASEKYKKVISDTHASLGADSPVPETPLNVTMRSLDKKTLGTKLADAFISKGLTDGSGKLIGGAVGGSLAHAAGLHAGVGALIGSSALGPFFNSVLPAIAKSVMGNPGNVAGFKAATDFASSVARGDELLTKASKNLFKAGAQILPQHVAATEKDRAKLDKLVAEAQANPDKMISGDNKLNHYMPQHSAAMAQTTANAIQYLTSLRPNTGKQSPLDSKPVMSTSQKATYNNALSLAQQPLSILDKIQKGTLTAQDLQHVNAMYPNLLNGIRLKLTQAMTDHIAKGNVVPYQTRIGLSTLMAQPLDSTMMPASIVSAQLAPPVSQQPQPKPKGTKSSPALQKMANMYNTPSQARQAEIQTKQ